MRAVLTNGSAFPVTYDFCLAMLEHASQVGWLAVPRYSPDTACTLAELVALPPSGSAELLQLVRQDMPRGIYRFRVAVGGQPVQEATLTTPEFQIQ